MFNWKYNLVCTTRQNNAMIVSPQAMIILIKSILACLVVILEPLLVKGGCNILDKNMQ